ncbi:MULTISPECIES: Stp1/IreP family PP2C-type Ser/Thr phosphatase [Paenibacillus]|uniref:Protein serine/threonine phosphatase n=2 Tax=Paenibacillus lactis TaxID=228574 RepID=G4HES3_9BACL|nr:Stp1/IreP family PP2C-type Ser/Thr phosphatase [Paenibacillus lactis]EHB65342.1 protein serine/threonine phosphatase [Paenibacillus lactis 154]MBP1896715.1 protein phosphatase [Paenibacillus lactis]MCM3495427.1 Stp1/IreP family PP2C-type Ser/Thr phosphatase [Paenibacillus lactis]HAF98901.1 Stp1/IreP family PP2C-type Ser/Thr phosphatase [Paenibacillus lactis]
MIRTVHVSHVGRVRPVNEDSVFVSTLEHGYTLGVVADGMGGHLAGDTASRLAVDTVAADLSSLEPGIPLEGIRAALGDAILHANEVIYQEASSDERLHNMGTTIVAVLLSGSEGYIGHIGDSRAYKVASGQVTRLTDDHTLVNELYKSGQITEDQLETHPRKNVLSRALGTDEDVTVELTPVSISDGEVLLLCSDGLSNRVSRDLIGQISGSLDLPLEERADRLLQLALLAGGEDNITVAMFEHQEEVVGQRKKGWDS